jgi:cytochrome d ubiquinol oxidase subunit I
MVIAAYLATALVVGASGAWHLLRGRDDVAVRTMTSMAMWMLLLVAPLQALVGDLHGLNTLKHQPAKIAAIEGHWENRPGEAVPLTLIGWPDMEREETRWKVDIPHLGSLILTHSWDGRIPALKEFAPGDRPNSTIVFWTFRVMVALGVAMIVLGVWAALARWRGTLYRSRPLLACALAMGPAGVVAILAGWMTTEIGRQPWVIHGVMRTADAVSPIGAAQVGLTLALFVVVYLAVFGAGILYMLKLIAKGPQALGQHEVPGGPGRPRQQMRPMSAAGSDGVVATPAQG